VPSVTAIAYAKVDRLYARRYIRCMPTALRDMQPWRRSLVEHGLTLTWAAERTGKSEHTVRAYSMGVRRAPADWIAAVELAVAEYVKGAPK
jgi:hypothetical protein